MLIVCKKYSLLEYSHFFPTVYFPFRKISDENTELFYSKTLFLGAVVTLQIQIFTQESCD